MAPGVHISIPRPPIFRSVIYRSLLTAPNRFADVNALQTDVCQQAVIQLAQLLLSIAAGQIGFELPHKARRCIKAVVANGFAAHKNRRHFNYSSSNRRLSFLSLSPNLLCDAQFQSLNRLQLHSKQAQVAQRVMLKTHCFVHQTLTKNLLRNHFEQNYSYNIMVFLYHRLISKVSHSASCRFIDTIYAWCAMQNAASQHFKPFSGQAHQSLILLAPLAVVPTNNLALDRNPLLASQPYAPQFQRPPPSS
jgi:hypothetical protein